MPKLLTAAGTASAAGLLTEVLYTRVLSAVYSPFYVYVVIGVALLGWGVSGVVATLLPAAFERESFRIVRWSWLGLGVTAPLALVLLSLFFVDHLVYHALIALALALPFFFAGTIGVCCYLFDPRTHAVYASCAAGGVAGALAAALASQALGVPVLLGLLSALAITLAGVSRSQRAACLAVGLLVASFGSRWLASLDLPAQRYKLHFAKNAPNATVEFTSWDPVARIDVVSFGAHYRTPNGAFECKAMTQDYSAPSWYFGGPENARSEFLAQWIASMAYWAKPAPKSVLVIGVGGGPDIQSALLAGAARVIAVDVNATVLALLRGPYDRFTGGIGRDARVRYVHEDGARFIRTSTERYDVIQQSGVDTDVASIGGTTRLAESYLYTREAVRNTYAHLQENGIAAYHWADFPEFLPVKERLYVTVLDVLRDAGLSTPERSVIVGGGGGLFTLLLKRGDFTPEEVSSVRRRFDRGLSESLFEMLHREHPDHPAVPGSPTGLWAAPGSSPAPFFAAANARARAPAPRWRELWSRFDMEPTDNNRPFFFVMDRVGGFTRNFEIVTQSLGVLAAQALFLLGLPFVGQRRRSAPERPLIRRLLAFAALGVGFSTIEVVLLQKFVYYIGVPSYSVAVVLTALLTGMTIGAVVCGRTRFEPRTVVIAATSAILVCCAIYMPLFDWFARSTEAAPLTARVALSTLVIAPLAALLGMPFPTAIAAIKSEGSSAQVAWLLAANTAGNALGVLVAVLATWSAGFRGVLLAAGTLYVLVTLLLFGIPPAAGSEMRGAENASA